MRKRPGEAAQCASPRTPLPWRAAAALLTMLATTTALSQFFRSSTAVIGPELIRDLALSPEALGFANGSFFMAVFLGQLPVGVAFDRFGVRLTVAVLSVPMAAGAMLHGLADTGLQLAAARFLVGIGCAASYTAGIVLISRWFPRPAWSTLISWQFALGQVGLLLAGTPLAAAVGWVGWRFPFVVMGLVAMLVGYVFLQVVRDAPPDVAGGAEEAEASAGIWRGLGQVLTTPGLVQVFCLYMVAFASLVTVQVVWAGPYLHDVFGLGPVERGNVLIGMALVQTMGVLVVGPLDRLFNTRKWVSVGSGCLALLAMTALALGPTSLPTAIGFLFLLSGSSAYGGVLFAQIRSLFPAHLAGRSATITNMAPLFGASVLPTLTGFIPPLFPHDASGYAPLAYQCIFATLAFCLAAGLGVYLTVEDTKPSPVEDAGSSAPRPDTG
ncbi:MAG TPA: MFS transporter [Hyphomicrobiaceae bacterium]|nr:MFS transporter [Hyphomicrobiaceae bacterium]